MMGFGVLLKKELREQFRTSRLVAVSAVFVLFGILSTLTDRYEKELFEAISKGMGTELGNVASILPPPSLLGVVAQVIKNFSQFGVICALLLAMGSVSWEKERGTAGMILTKPASRGAFLAAKLVAISVNLLIAVILGCGLAYLYTFLLYPSVFPAAGYLAMSAILWWTMVIFVALTMFGSTLLRSAIASAGLAFVAFLVLGLVALAPIIGPWSPLGLQGPALNLAVGKDAGDFLGPLIFNLALVPLLFGATWLVFRRQEL